MSNANMLIHDLVSETHSFCFVICSHFSYGMDYSMSIDCVLFHPKIAIERVRTLEEWYTSVSEKVDKLLKQYGVDDWYDLPTEVVDKLEQERDPFDSKKYLDMEDQNWTIKVLSSNESPVFIHEEEYHLKEFIEGVKKLGFDV